MTEASGLGLRNGGPKIAQQFIGLTRPAITGGEIRVATPEDAAAVRTLDDAAFPLHIFYYQRSDQGSLESAVARGDVRILEFEGKPVAYLNADRHSVPGQIYIEGVAVDPVFQASGLGTRLIRACLDEVAGLDRDTTPVVTVTSPLNHRMLSLTFRHGFAARWILRGFFGESRDRFGLQLAGPGWPPPIHLRVPATALDAVYALVETGDFVVCGVRRTLGGRTAFDLARTADANLLPARPPG